MTGHQLLPNLVHTPTEILFEINEITEFSKSEIKKFGMETSKSSKFMFPVMLKIPVTPSKYQSFPQSS